MLVICLCSQFPFLCTWLCVVWSWQSWNSIFYPPIQLAPGYVLQGNVQNRARMEKSQGGKEATFFFLDDSGGILQCTSGYQLDSCVNISNGIISYHGSKFRTSGGNISRIVIAGTHKSTAPAEQWHQSLIPGYQLPPDFLLPFVPELLPYFYAWFPVLNFTLRYLCWYGWEVSHT